MADNMIELALVTNSDKEIISNLLQFYMFEFNQISQFKHFSLGDKGRYEQYPYFENYWLEPNRFPYVIMQNQSIVGFSLAHDITINESISWKLAEFFVMPEFRRQGLGTQAAIATIKTCRGGWEISVLKDNHQAKQFWLNVFQQLSVDFHTYHYLEYELFEININ